MVLGALADQVGHAAALLEGELLPEVAGDVLAVGLDLLPGAGEVQPRCSCPDWADPCKHAAAVCYLVADELDRDPFLLFTLRGKSRQELLAGARQRRGYPHGDPPGTANDHDLAGGASWEVDAGVVAREVWSRNGLTPPPAPSLPAPPRHPGRPPLVLDAAPQGSGVDSGALVALAADAARRAWDLASGGHASGLDLTFEEDCARWAAAMVQGLPAPGGFDELARRCGVDRRKLFFRALAWKSGGYGGLATFSEAWDPAPSEMDPGRVELGPGARTTRNRVSLGDRQLRLGRDGEWSPYRKVRGVWQPQGEAVVLPGSGRPSTSRYMSPV